MYTNTCDVSLHDYLTVFLVVQRLSVGVMFPDERINKEQEQHVEQQCTHNRQVNDDGYLEHLANGSHKDVILQHITKTGHNKHFNFIFSRGVYLSHKSINDRFCGNTIQNATKQR